MSENVIPTTWPFLQETLAKYRQECEAMEHMIDSQFEELEQLRSALDNQSSVLIDQRHSLIEQERSFSEQKEQANHITQNNDHQEAQLEDTRQQLAETQEELSRLHEQFDTVSAQTANNNDFAGERKNLQQELADSRAEIIRYKQENILRVKEEKNGGNESYIAEQEHKRSVLESELERVRCRAAQLYESVAEQKQEMTTQRTEMGEELKQLRRIIETLASGSTQDSSPHAKAPPEPATPDNQPATKAPTDPVVSSVMAQFAKLQRDVAQRRARKQ